MKLLKALGIGVGVMFIIFVLTTAITVGESYAPITTGIIMIVIAIITFTYIAYENIK